MTEYPSIGWLPNHCCVELKMPVIVAPVVASTPETRPLGADRSKQS